MTWSTCASWSYKCGCLKCVACHHKTWRDAEEIVFVLWRFRDSHWVWLFFSKLLPEALYASILNSMRREGKGLSFHRRSSFDHPLVSRKTAKKKFGSLYYNDAGRILWIACNGDFWPKFLLTLLAWVFMAYTDVSNLYYSHWTTGVFANQFV